jgi:hypothetical protein
MHESIPHTAGSLRMKWQYRIGLRFLLVMVLLAALTLAWVARESRRAQLREALVAELTQVGVSPLLEEPTGVGQLVKGLLPRYERRLGDWIGRGWFDRPTVFVCKGLEDQQVPFVVERLSRLGTVREIHTQGLRLTPQGDSGLRSGLPGVNVVPLANPALHQYFNDQVNHEHFAGEGLKLAGLLALGLLGTLIFLAWPLSRRRPRTARRVN